MANLKNDDNSIELKILILKNEYTDIKENRDDYENYIPFDFKLIAENETYSFPYCPTFSIYEIKTFLYDLKRLIEKKKSDEEVKILNFYSSEAYFEMSIYDTEEKDELYVDCWLNVGSLTDGKKYGYHKGYRFIVELDMLEKFYLKIKEELKYFSYC